jgi:hypothetical protein|tara:strand:+ start:2284 stop:2631 length:348 start_codon:yes stop_codon:yes gene_type:complete
MPDTVDDLLARSPEEFRTRAIQALVPEGTSWGFSADDTGYVITFDDPKDGDPTKAEIDAKAIELQAEYVTQQYARNRQAEYPSIESLIVGLYDTDDKSAIEAKRAAVKLKYPKPL